MSDNLLGSLGGGSFVIAPSQQSVFDMSEESSVISLLKLIHQNPFDAEAKNHLRDLIFTYRQTQTKENLAAIRDACLPFGVSITVPNNESKAEIAVQQLSTFGTTRPQPLFRSLGKETAKAVLSETVLEPVVVMPQQWPKSDQTPTDAQPVVVQTRIQETSPLQQDAPVLTKEKSNSVVHVDVQERIKEIKKLVNDKVGNPINLIDAHNEVGREYMNALLDAMKKSNGGKLEEVEQAMERLETAFAHVQGAITGNGEMKKEIVSHGEQSASSIAKMPEDKNVAAEADAQQVDISPLENVTPVATEPMAQIRTIPVVHGQPVNLVAIERLQPERWMTTSHANL